MDICVIEVNLDVAGIINEGLSEITSQNKASIDEAIGEAKRLQKVKDDKERAEKELVEKVVLAYKKLEEAAQNNQMVSAVVLLAFANPHITNLSSLMQRLRGYIKSNNIPKEIVGFKKKKEQFYCLEDAKAEATEEAVETEVFEPEQEPILPSDA